MKTVSLVLFSLALVSAAVAARPKAKKPAKQPERAVVVVTGKLICSHCELSVGEDCCSALQIKNTIFLLSGQANKELFPKRLAGGVRKVIGTVSKKGDQLQLTGVQLKLGKKSKKGYSITGLLKKSGKYLILANGKQPIRLTGKAAKPLAKNTGKLAELTGDLKFDLRGRLRLKPKTSKVVKKKPVIPVVKSKK